MRSRAEVEAAVKKALALRGDIAQAIEETDRYFSYRHSQLMDFSAKDMDEHVQKIADRFPDKAAQDEFYRTLKTYADKKEKSGLPSHVHQVGHKWVGKEHGSAWGMVAHSARIHEAIQSTTSESRKGMQEDMDASLQRARSIEEGGIDSSDEEEAGAGDIGEGG